MSRVIIVAIVYMLVMMVTCVMEDKEDVNLSSSPGPPYSLPKLPILMIRPAATPPSTNSRQKDRNTVFSTFPSIEYQVFTPITTTGKNKVLNAHVDYKLYDTTVPSLYDTTDELPPFFQPMPFKDQKGFSFMESPLAKRISLLDSKDTAEKYQTTYLPTILDISFSHEVDDIEKFTLSDAITNKTEYLDQQPFKKHLDVLKYQITTKTMETPSLGENYGISLLLFPIIFLGSFVFIVLIYFSNVTLQKVYTEEHDNDSVHIYNMIDRFVQKFNKNFQ